MNQAARGAAAAWILLGVSLLAWPGRADAQRSHDGQATSPATAPGFVAAPAPPRPPGALPAPGPGNQRPYTHRPYAHRPSRPGVIGVPVPVYVPSPVPVGIPDPYVWPYPYDPAMLYAPPSMDWPPAAPVEYPTGRYELRGDGVTTLYQWVWVPNPPPAAPPAPPTPPPGPPAAPAAPPETAAPPVSPAAPSPPVEVYRFTDEQGVVTWTDRWDSIPERYRSQARRLPF
jgi:hypothetical protein